MSTVLISLDGPIFKQLSETAPEDFIRIPLSRNSLTEMVGGLKRAHQSKAENIIFIMGDLRTTLFLFRAVNPAFFFSAFKCVTMIFADGEKPQWTNNRIAFSKLAHKIVRMDTYNDDMPGVIQGAYLPIKKSDWYMNEEKDIGFGFYGSLNLYTKRKEVIEYLKSANVPITIGGGEENKYSLDMMKELRRTKVTLNFSSCISKPGKSYDGEVHQIKGRVWEAAMAKCVLLEPYDSPASKIFNKDEIILYRDMSDIPGLVDKLLKNDDLRLSIAENAFQKAKQYADPDIYWGKLL